VAQVSGYATRIGENADRALVESTRNVAKRDQDFLRRGICLWGKGHSEVALAPPRIVGTGDRPTNAVVEGIGFRSKIAMNFCQTFCGPLAASTIADRWTIAICGPCAGRVAQTNAMNIKTEAYAGDYLLNHYSSIHRACWTDPFDL
jgi:hypothetical protein